MTTSRLRVVKELILLTRFSTNVFFDYKSDVINLRRNEVCDSGSSSFHFDHM